MGKLFLSESGNEVRRLADIDMSGRAVISGLQKNTEYIVDIRTTNIFSYPRTKDEFIIFKENAQSILERDHLITTMEQDFDQTFTLVWNKYPNYSWIERLKILMEQLALINLATDQINYDTITKLEDTLDYAVQKYIAGIKIPGGKVICVPYRGTQFAVFDPVDNSVTKFGYTFAGSEKWISGVLLYDNTIFCPPFLTDIAAFINTETLEVTWQTGYDSYHQYGGSLLLADGRVFLFPRTSSRCAIFDPISRTITEIGEQVATAYFSGVLLENGDLVGIPSGMFTGSTGRVLYYTSKTNSVSEIGINLGLNPNQSFTKGILIENNKILCPRRYHSQNLLIDGNNKTTTLVGPTGSGDQYYSGCLLGDGRVFAPPTSINTMMFINTKTFEETYLEYTRTVSSWEFHGSVLLDDGRILCLPHNGQYFVVISASNGIYKTIPPAASLSSFINKF